MFKIRAVKIEVNTHSGLFGAKYEFEEGLNIIRGDNSTGKSSLFQSIIYALGFEELLGGKNDKTMQSALKELVEFPNNKFHSVIQSFVFLEIEASQIITTKRSITSQSRKPQLLDVYFGAYLTENNPALESSPMYIHDQGGASDEMYGFHLFLADFLGWELPEVITKNGDLQKLYLQQLAPAFIIEQKAGWSDFFATMPYFGMRNTELRVVEFLLKLDVFENEKLKQKINTELQIIKAKWSNLHSQFFRLAEKCGGTLNGFPLTPEIINNYKEIYISVLNDEIPLSLVELNRSFSQELNDLEKASTLSVGTGINKNEKALNEKTQKLNQLSLNYELLSPELNFDKEKLRQYSKQIDVVIEDLRKNKGALKVKKLGADLPTEIGNDICPTCHQEVKDSLLPNDIQQVPMGIKDNISFLEAQKKMIEVYIDGQNKLIVEKEKRLAQYQKSLSEVRQEIRSLKRELIQDERLPSILEIEKRLNLKKKFEFYEKAIEDFTLLIEELEKLSKEYQSAIAKKQKLRNDFFSTKDREKLGKLQDYFLSLLKNFEYKSKPLSSIKVSFEDYLPSVEKILANGRKVLNKITFDSSASDFIRCIWAYTTALFKVSLDFDTNHPKLLIFDEPKQQDISISNFRTFLIELSQYSEHQILVFASFENSDSAFEATTQGIDFKLHRIEVKLIRPISR